MVNFNKEQSCNKIIGRLVFSYHSTLKTNLNLKVNTDLLENDVIIDVYDDCVIIKRPDLDYCGKTYKLNKKKSGWYGTTLYLQLPIGKYVFDEDESNEDELIAYYR